MFFDDWFGLVRVLVVGTMAYAALIALLRVSGKRSLSKMNAFDLVVNVALGSTFAAVILDNSIPLAEGVSALALLVGLHSSSLGPRFASSRCASWSRASPLCVPKTSSAFQRMEFSERTGEC